MSRWSIPFHEVARRQKLRIETVVRAATLEIFSRVVIRSPVDTGRFRANWNLSYNEIVTTVSANMEKEASPKLQQMKSALLAIPLGGLTYLCNSLPYARVLEYGEYPNPPKYGSKKRGEDGIAIHVQGGFSFQAPSGMVRVTAAEFAGAVEESLKR